MSWLCTRTSIKVSRWVTPKLCLREPTVARMPAMIWSVGLVACRRASSRINEFIPPTNSRRGACANSLTI
jgi:hypothetical protein